MNGWIETLSGTWADLASVGCEEWLWLDTDGDGVHLSATVPAEPAQVTHVWGWGPDRAVRARVDVDLPHASGETGLAGAVLRWGQGQPAGSDVVDLEEGTHRVWKAGGGRASIAQVAGLHEPDGNGVQLRTLTCAVWTDAGDALVSQSISFLRR